MDIFYYYLSFNDIHLLTKLCTAFIICLDTDKELIKLII